jgi:ribosome-binding protein aMBF1 (putative translation factor)
MQLEIFRPQKFFELLYSSRFQPSHGTSLQLRYLYPLKFEEKKIEAAKKVFTQHKSTKFHNANNTSTSIANLTGEALKQARLSKGWTQTHLASLIGKSVSWVKLAEGGLRRIKEDDQIRLQIILNLQ